MTTLAREARLSREAPYSPSSGSSSIGWSVFLAGEGVAGPLVANREGPDGPQAFYAGGLPLLWGEVFKNPKSKQDR